MADDNWATVRIGIPVELTAAADVLNSVIEFLIAIANVALATLEVVKALLIGLLDPFRTILEQLIAEVEAFLRDIRQLGIYVTWDEPKWPFDNISGGFQAYQSRMLAKLTNRNDPTRPDFSDRSGVVGIFLYASADPTAIYTVIGLIDQLLRLFGIHKPMAETFPVPVGLTVKYGSGAMFGNLSRSLASGTTPDVARVQWGLAAPSTIIGPMPLVPAPPKFLIEVSTVKDGFGVAYNLPPPNASGDRQTFGVVTNPNGDPYRVYGGDTLGIPESLTSKPSGNSYDIPGIGEDNKPKTNNVTVYAFKDSADTVPTPLSAITGVQPDGKYLFQRTFVYDVQSLLGINLVLPGQPFSFRLNAADMPYNATVEAGSGGKVVVTPDDAPAREVYVRVRAIGEGFEADADRSLATPLHYIDESTFNATGTVGSAGVVLRPAGAPADPAWDQRKVGPLSDAVKVTFPADGTADYLDTVTVALLLLLMSRSDLRPMITKPGASYNGPGEPVIEILAGNDPTDNADANALIRSGGKDVGFLPTGLEALAAQILPKFIEGSGGLSLAKLFGKEGDDPGRYRRQLLHQCQRIALAFVEASGPPDPAVLTFIDQVSQVSGTVQGLVGDTFDKVVAPTPLRKLRWGQIVPEISRSTLGDKTILESFTDRVSVYTGGQNIGANTDTIVSGLAPNPLSIENVKVSLLKTFYFSGTTIIGDGLTSPRQNGYALQRAPGFLLKVSSTSLVSTGFGQGSADMSPVVYAGTTPLWTKGMKLQPTQVVFVRNVVIRLPSLSAAIGAVLGYAQAASYATGKADGAWTMFRFFPQGIPAIDEFLQKISDFLATVLDGLQGILDAILAFIAFVEARILEFEALLRRIQGLISLVLSLSLDTPMAALVVTTSSGTNGLVRSLLSAGNAPADGQASLGFGAALVAGGVPSFILDIILLFFPPEEE